MKAQIEKYIQDSIPAFHQRRIESLSRLKLKKVLQRKNPYLFRAKNVNAAPELVAGILDAHLSSQEETIFGALIENVAIYACSLYCSGFKSGIEGIDLEFTLDEKRYIVAVKSGPNWGNSSQIKRMHDNFKRAAIVLRQTGTIKNVVAINGCCYGKSAIEDKGDYLKICGQSFWTLISGNKDLYTEIIEPFGYEAKKRNDEFQIEYSKVMNKFTLEFIQDFCDPDGQINWKKIVEFNSSKAQPKKTVD